MSHADTVDPDARSTLWLMVAALALRHCAHHAAPSSNATVSATNAIVARQVAAEALALSNFFTIDALRPRVGTSEATAAVVGDGEGNYDDDGDLPPLEPRTPPPERDDLLHDATNALDEPWITFRAPEALSAVSTPPTTATEPPAEFTPAKEDRADNGRARSVTAAPRQKINHEKLKRAVATLEAIFARRLEEGETSVGGEQGEPRFAAPRGPPTPPPPEVFEDDDFFGTGPDPGPGGDDSASDADEREDDFAEFRCCDACAASRSPMHSAAEAGHWRCIRALPEGAANATADWPKVPGFGTALHVAAVNRKYKCIRTLFRKGTDLNAKTTRLAMTAMSLSASISDVRGLKLLADLGANPNKGAVLHAATASGSAECVTALLDLGVAVDCGWNGSTPMVVAATQGHNHIVRLLASRGASVNATPKTHAPPIIAAMAAGNASTVDLLLDLGVDANSRSPTGQPLLHEAVRVKVAGITASLIRHGADMNLKVTMATPLVRALMHSNQYALRELLEGGADTTKTFDHRNILELAKSLRSGPEIVQLLQEALKARAAAAATTEATVDGSDAA